MDFTLTQWGLLGGATLLIGLSKCGLPGAGTLAIPVFAMLIPAKASTGALLPLLVCGDIIGVAVYHRHADWPQLLRLFPWTVTGILGGWLALDRLSNAQIGPIIGAIILGLLGLNLWRKRQAGDDARLPSGAGFSALVGLLAGFTTMIANAAGPIMAIYLLSRRLPKAAFIGTSAWFFLLVNLAKIPFSANLGLITGDSLRFNLLLLPSLALGAAAGYRFAHRLPQRWFEVIIQILAALAALRLLR
jgi:uncharacterized membrane protein YfcA